MIYKVIVQTKETNFYEFGSRRAARHFIGSIIKNGIPKENIEFIGVKRFKF